MAESTTRNQDFKAKKEIFDKIASKVCCSFCKIVPRGAPIYQAKGPKGKIHKLRGGNFSTHLYSNSQGFSFRQEFFKVTKIIFFEIIAEKVV